MQYFNVHRERSNNCTNYDHPDGGNEIREVEGNAKGCQG